MDIQQTLLTIALFTAFLLYGFDGYRRGFLFLILELVGTLFAFGLAFSFAAPVGQLLVPLFHLPTTLTRAVGFLALWVIIEIIWSSVISLGYHLLPETIRQSFINRVLGIIPSLAKGALVIALVLTLLVVFPSTSQLRPLILNNQLAEPLVRTTQNAQQKLFERYDKELTETLTFLTTTPIVKKIEEPGELIQLPFKTTDVKADPTSEARMLELVNQERVKQGLKPLTASEPLRAVARAHAIDMLARGYFSHISPEGTDPFERMTAAGVNYLAAGENLAFAPTVDLAHVGLMNSPKHRDNILSTDFGQVGIGVINAGQYGRMFVQNFQE